MGRFLFIVGLILTVVGFVGPFLSLGSLFSGVDSMVNLATNSDTQQAELCNEGETLEREYGSSTRDTSGTYGRAVILYCVDADGERREVTSDLMDNMFEGGFFGNIGDSIGQTMLFIGLGTLGTFLMVFGGISSMMGKRKNMFMMNPYNSTINMNPTPMQPMNQGSVWTNPSPSTTQQGSLAAQLQQLEQAYNQNLITREEYDKARQNLLNNMK